MNLNNPVSIGALLAASLISTTELSYASERDKLIGTWCFYEQEAVGNTVDEQVTITLEPDGNYRWREPVWHQDGQWRVEDGVLYMTMVGHHILTTIQTDFIEMRRGSVMRMRRGSCA